MKKLFLAFSFSMLSLLALAQEKLTYQQPPKEILELVNAPLAPSVQIDRKGENLVLLYRDPFNSIAELSEEEMRLAGLRINPKTNIGSRTNYYNNIEVKKASAANAEAVTGLPANPRMSNFRWSPEQDMMAFTHTTASGVEAWVLDIKTRKAKRLTDANLNANISDPLTWFKDGKALLVTMLPEDRKNLINTAEAVPEGPVISVSSGEKAQNRTYQDLLKNPNDEHNFEALTESELFKVKLDGSKNKWLHKAMYSWVNFSPDGQYVLVTHIKRPFSYLVPYYRFPSSTTVYDVSGKVVQNIAEVPLTEVLPKGFMAVREGRRGINWRSDKPHTVVWEQALDGGDPENEVEFRDEVFELEAPFNGTPHSLFKSKNRMSWIQWGNDNMAIAHDYWWNNRNTKSYLFNPSDPSQEVVTLYDRNYQDRYNDPGNFVTERNAYGENVLVLKGKKAYLIGDGYSEEGQHPFVDELDLESQETKRLYRSGYTNKAENLYFAIDMSVGDILVRLESPTEYPNYYIRNIYEDNSLSPLTSFENPFKAIQGVHKEVITYKRDDGLELDATLYLPVGYDMDNKEKLPMIMWAYPREFKDKNSASQNTSNPNEFTYPWYGSPIYWLTQGYVVLDDAAFPIVGEGDEEPNETFRKQLVANAQAAIDAVDDMGYIDRNRVAVGGHSYGAFMVANLLSHSDLFAAGIARSGAYNRTQTPFGFQSEERSYWDTPETYYEMSPFMHADKMKTPLLL